MPAQSAVRAAASEASVACWTRPESSPPVKIGSAISARVIPELIGAGLFGSLWTKSGNENVPWFSFRAKTSAGLFVRVQRAVRLSDGRRNPLACEARASAACWRARAATTSRAFSRARCIAPERVRTSSAAGAGNAASVPSAASAMRSRMDRFGFIEPPRDSLKKRRQL